MIENSPVSCVICCRIRDTAINCRHCKPLFNIFPHRNGVEFGKEVRRRYNLGLTIASFVVSV